MADFLPVKKLERRMRYHLSVEVPPSLKGKMDPLEYIERRRKRLQATKGGFQSLLRRAGITKTQMAQRVGMAKVTVYEWTDETLPRWAKAYLELWIEYQRLRP